MGIRRTVGLLQGDDFFQRELPIYVNRVVETYDLTEHRHDFVEISYVSEGTGTHYIGDHSLPVAQGDLFLIPVGVSHVFRPATAVRERPLVVCNCLLSAEAASELVRRLPGAEPLRELLERREWRMYRDRFGAYGRLFRQLHDEYAGNRPDRETALHLAALNLLLRLYREENEADAGSSRASGIEAALRHLHTRYDEPVSLQRMAALAGVGERQFRRLFTQRTGMALTGYVQNVRIAEACRLLRETGRKTGDIAAAVGYRDLPYFNRLFKRKTGVSPREYRRRCAQD